MLATPPWGLLSSAITAAVWGWCSRSPTGNEKLGENTWVGFVRSTVLAWIVVRLGGLLRKAGVRMQI